MPIFRCVMKFLKELLYSIGRTLKETLKNCCFLKIKAAVVRFSVLPDDFLFLQKI